MRLVEAHALLVHGCKRTACAPRLLIGRRPVPWVLGLEPTIVAEPWSNLHALHRRKRGFTAACQRLEAVLDVVRSAAPGPVTLEVWSDDGTFDAGLLTKIGARLDAPLVAVGPPQIAEALAAVRARLTPAHASHTNPLIAVLSWADSVTRGVAVGPPPTD